MMEKEQINFLFEQFERIRNEYKGVECWSARDLQLLLGYSKWENFLKVIDKAKQATKNVKINTKDHFVELKRNVDLGSGSRRNIHDIALTRYACYLIAQNGDSSKPDIAFAQTYFAVQTRKQEIIEKRLLDVARLNAREKLSKSEKKLSEIIFERGVDEMGFALIRSKGDKALFGGFNTNEMKKKLGVPEKRPLADFLPTLTIKAKDFATELTSHNVVEKDLKGDKSISVEHIENNNAVRKMLLERGVKPESLPPSEDIKILKKNLHKEVKQIEKDAKNRP